MNKLRRIRRLAGFVAVTGGIAVLAAQLPADTWARIGQTTALAAVSLQQPNEAAAQLSERLERLPAAAETGAATEIPVTGDTTTTGETTTVSSVDPTVSEGTTAPVVIPPEDGSGGKVVEQQVGGGTMMAGLAVKNKSGITPDLNEALSAALSYTVEFGSAEPQVLIYHTHATETYMPYDAGYFNAGDTARIPDNANNVRAVGDALAAALTAAGVTVLHDATLHDYPEYRGAYDRSAETIQTILKAHPSIKVILDIHRDGLMVNDTDKLKPTVTVDGQKAAQLMVVCGVLTTDALPHPNWRQNLAFAAQLQQTLAARYDGLARPLSLVASRYNQHLSPGALLVEVGSEGNTLAEATYSARLLAQALVQLWS